MWPSKIIHCVMFNTLFRVLVEIFEEKSWSLRKNLIGWRKCVFEDFWNHSYTFHIMKTGFKLCFYRKFQVFKKKNLWVFMFSIDWTFFSTNRKMWIFRPKLIANSIPIRLLLDQSNFVSLNLRSLLDCSRLIEIRIFWIRKAFDTSVYPIPFHSLQFLSFLENFLLSLLESKLQGFLRCHLVRLFYHFLSIIFNLHMHNHQIF